MLLLLFNQPSINYSLDCSAGSYSLSGQSADLAYSPGAVAYTLDCDFGTYTITGQNAVLNYTPKQTGKSHDPHKYDFLLDQNVLAKKPITPTTLVEVEALVEDHSDLVDDERAIEAEIQRLQREIEQVSNYNRNLSKLVADSEQEFKQKQIKRQQIAKLKEKQRQIQEEDDQIMKLIAELL